MGLTSALQIAGQSLQLFRTGVEVTGQNVANANTPGYVREQLNAEANPPNRQGDLLIGSGARALSITQKIDSFLEKRIHSANADFQASDARRTVYQQLEGIIRELGDSDLSTRMSEFVAALHDVANQPESASLRQVAVQQGEQLATDIVTLRSRIDKVREAQTAKVDSLVEEANRLIDTVAELNPRIANLEAGSQSDAGGLRSQRLEALNRLSELIPTRVVERENGRVDVFSGSNYLVLSGTHQHLETVTSVDRGVVVHDVRLTTTQADISTSGGRLKGLIEAQNEIAGGLVDELDKLAGNLIAEFNKIHASGEGLAAHSSVTAEHEVFQTGVSLDQTDLPFTPEHGSFQFKVTDTLSGQTETTNIAVDLDGLGGDDTTLQDLRDALNAVNNVSASIGADGRLQVDADADYEFRFADDTSGVLTSLGINTFFTGADSRDIGVSDTISDDHRLFATGQGGGPSDGRNVSQLTQFLENPVDDLDGLSLDGFYEATISSLGQAGASEAAVADGFDGFRQSLVTRREQISGVSLDEEAVRLLQFQQAYQASARMVSTLDELFNTVLNL